MRLKRLSLGGRWRFCRVGARRSRPATVPGSVHADLLALGEIEDPFFRENEKDLQWIGETDWRYWRDFRVAASLLESDRVLLRCHGLDTLATLRINGKLVARADNMHPDLGVRRQAKARVGEQPHRGPLRVGGQGGAQASAGGAPARLVPDAVPEGASWLRKEPCNFGWDWGPGLVTCGIWREIELVAFDTARLADVQIVQDHSGARAVVVEVRAAGGAAPTAIARGSPR